MLTLSEIVTILVKADLLREVVIDGEWRGDYSSITKDFEISAIEYDSRKICPGSLFICKGMNFKTEYLYNSLKQGAIGYMSEYVIDEQTEVAIIVKNIQKAMAVVARAFYNYPDRYLTTIGITGTKGKTTTTYMVRQILADVNHDKVAQISSEDNILDGTTKENSSLTTPESLDLFKMMANAISNGIKYFVMEVSSQAYKMSRVYGITFDYGIFLNIGNDHISDCEHKTFDDYFSCKLELINNSKQIILNNQSNYSKFIEEQLQTKDVSYCTYGVEDDSEFRYEVLDNNQFKLIKPNIDILLQNKMPGDFNISNAMAAIVLALLNDIDITDVKESLTKVVVPGRMEKISSHSNIGYVDYAHNYLSLKEAMSYLKEQYPDRRLIVVTGCYGDKAKNRRYDVAKALTEEADIAILTQSDSQNEDSYDIIEEIASNLNDSKLEVYLIIERSEAIKTACSLAENGDIVVAFGKGHDQYIKVKGEKIPYEGDHNLMSKYLN